MTGIVALLALVAPGLSEEVGPTQNFLYRWGNYDSYYDYQVSGGRLVVRRLRDPGPNGARPLQRYFIYDPVTKSNSELNEEDAQRVALTSEERSLNGYEVSRDRSSSRFLFAPRNRHANIVLLGEFSREKVELPKDFDPYYRPINFHFVGWVSAHE